jgi:MFS family permease
MTVPSRMIKSPFNVLVIVAALGYFVDIYDLILFNVIKKESLEALGLGGVNYESNEIFLFNCQMAGMLIGGLLWGILGDKKGRLSVLFGSILLYSSANIANAFAETLPQYALIRLLAGLGLAGELGAGITLVVESMSKESRGYGTMLIVTFGALGAVFASIVGKQGAAFAVIVNQWCGTSLVGWQMAYIVGGALGIFLLLLRVGTFESAMFRSVKESDVGRGNFFGLLKKRHLVRRYIFCILIGLPVWYIIGILIALCISLSTEMGIVGVQTGTAVMYAYIGLSAGDLLSGIFSQVRQSRKRVVIAFLFFSLILSTFFLFPITINLDWFYYMCFLLGAATGYWALFVTMASELFGTNIRSTVTNTVPNFVRGSVIPLTLFYKFLAELLSDFSSHPRVTSAAIVGLVSFSLAIWAIFSLRDSFHRELNYVDEL